MRLSKRTKKQIDWLLKNNGEHWLVAIEKGFKEKALKEQRGVEQPGSSHGS